MRARQIKPGFFTDPDLCSRSGHARLLFAGLWCLADRAGRLEDRPREIRAAVFPHESHLNVDALLDELAEPREDSEGGFVLRYTAVIDRGRGPEQRKFIQIRNFPVHQNPHPNERESTLPPPPDHAPRDVARAVVACHERSLHLASTRAGSSGSSGPSGPSAAAPAARVRAREAPEPPPPPADEASAPPAAVEEPPRARGPAPPGEGRDELSTERTALAEIAQRVAELTAETRPEVCLRHSRTERGKAFSDPAECRSVPWLRATRDRLSVELARLRATERHEADRAPPLPPAREPERAAAAWVAVLEHVEAKLNRHSFATWFRPTEGYSLDGDVLRVRVPNAVFAEWLQKNYAEATGDAAREAGLAGRVEFVHGELAREREREEVMR